MEPRKKSPTNVGVGSMKYARNVGGWDNGWILRRMKMEKIPNFRSVRTVEVIQTVTLEGSGTEEDTYRQVTWYHERNGGFLAKYDPEQWKKENPL